MGLALAPAVASEGGGALLAQAPHEAWRTLELPHFRVHYPAASEAWPRRTAARLEAVRERLAGEIGYAPSQVVDVLVSDPLSRSNGLAVALLARPRMVLWTSPPEPGSLLGRYREWGEMVALHEDAHLVHLLRPSRNPWRRLVARLLPGGGIGPIARRAPRWVTEGYATLLEGRLTASGRPNSDLRAAILRSRARAGRLPSYGALGSAEERSWLGPSMAYLAGSAYLEWLEARGHPGGAEGDGPADGVLRDLWARMTARRDRSFQEAFEGVFGQDPAELYGRFTAELTWRALEVERRLEGTGRAGTLWTDLSWATGTPAVSPDGARLAAVLRHREEPPRLVVWETAVDEAAEERWREERDRIAEADPEDVPAVRTAPPARKRVATLPTFDGRAPRDPRWTPDGEALLFAALGPGPDGFLHGDLYRWDVDAGRVERLTRGADLRSPDPVPSEAAGPSGAGTAVAVRSRHGYSQLVGVDLASGAVRELTEPSVEVVWAAPRVAADGGRLAALQHRGGRWRLVVADLPSPGEAPGPWRELPVPAGATVADPAWAPEGGTLYAAVGMEGFFDLWAFETRGRRLTRTLGGALGPEPTPGGEALFYLSLKHDGLDLRRLELGPEGSAAEPREDPGETGAPAAPEPLPGSLAPAILPAPPDGAGPFPTAELPPARPYGLGPQELTPLLGTALAPSGLAVEAGAHLGDPLGRLGVVLLGSAGSDGALEGGVLAASWRGLPVELSAAAFAVRHEPSAQDDPPAGLPGPGAGPAADPAGGAGAGPLAVLDRDQA
ncbi:MAG: TolB family protein, partial [Thermoanaerobaculia bacterium]